MYIKNEVKASSSHFYLYTMFLCRFQWGTIADHVNKPAPLDSDTCYPVSIVLNVCDYFARWSSRVAASKGLVPICYTASRRTFQL